MQTHPQTSATYANPDFRSRQKTCMQKKCLDVVNVARSKYSIPAPESALPHAKVCWLCKKISAYQDRHFSQNPGKYNGWKSHQKSHFTTLRAKRALKGETFRFCLQKGASFGLKIEGANFGAILCFFNFPKFAPLTADFYQKSPIFPFFELASLAMV